MDLTKIIGFGVAGNFAGHLEQAGEASDFMDVEVKEETQPKAIFPFYVPSKDAGFLSEFPLSSNTVSAPETDGNVQIEPEVAIYCKIQYDGTRVVGLEPLKFGAYNDCSIRRPNANKISEKKNWGASSKGLSANLLDIDTFAEGGILDQYRIACFMKRDGEYHAYGADSAVVEYSYFHTKLLDWIVDCMNNQPNSGPMDCIPDQLKLADYPEYTLISVGATRYTEFGETHFLQKGDQAVVVVYDGTAYQPESIVAVLESGEYSNSNMSVLIQDVK